MKLTLALASLIAGYFNIVCGAPAENEPGHGEPGHVHEDGENLRALEVEQVAQRCSPTRFRAC